MDGRFSEMKARGEKIAALTCYDATFARAMVEARIEMILVGDSLGMTVQGNASTTGVTLADVEYHTRCVAQAAHGPCVVADMPLEGMGDAEKLSANARRLLFAGAEMVKIEGGEALAERIAGVVGDGIPVCGHIGLLPQSGTKSGMRRAVDDAGIRQLERDAAALERAGVSLIVLEMVSMEGVEAVGRATDVPTIGIGSGSGCDGQILVMHDMLGLLPTGRDKPLRFVKNFMEEACGVVAAFAAYRDQVKAGTFPGAEHAFSRA